MAPLNPLSVFVTVPAHPAPERLLNVLESQLICQMALNAMSEVVLPEDAAYQESFLTSQVQIVKAHAALLDPGLVVYDLMASNPVLGRRKMPAFDPLGLSVDEQDGLRVAAIMGHDFCRHIEQATQVAPEQPR